ncbi:MAG: putative cytokinetic ring protein SteA [Methylocystaceae bacterium]
MKLQGKAKADHRTKDLTKRLRRGEIAVIDHDDIDEVAAESLLEIKPLAIINARESITGSYPTRGVLKLIHGGIPVIDQVGPEIFDCIRDGALVEIHDGDIYLHDELIAQGQVLTREMIEDKLREAEANFQVVLADFVENTLDYARREKNILLQDMPLPDLKVRFFKRPVLIVVRGKNYKEDLKVLSSYIKEEKPVLIGVDGGADALLECGFTPHVIVGDMDSVSDRALCSGAELVVHAYRNGKAPGLSRVEEMQLPCHVLPLTGTSEDVAMLMAYEAGCSLIVAVGTHSNIVDFLEKGRRGMASTFLVRLKVGSILVDAKGVSQLYRQGLQGKYLLQLLVAALIPIFILLWVSPSTKPILELVWLQLKLMTSI